MRYILDRPIITITILYIIGIIIGRIEGRIPASYIYLILAGVTILSLIARIRRSYLAQYGIALAFILLGGWLCRIGFEPPSADHIRNFTNRDDIQAIEGEVVSDPIHRGDRIYLIFRAEKIELEGREKDVEGLIKVTLANYYEEVQWPELNYGDRVIFKRPAYDPPRVSVPGVFDYRAYLIRHKIFALMSVWKLDQVEIIGKGGGNPLLRGAISARKWLLSIIYNTLPEPKHPHSQLLGGIMLGVQSDLPEETYEIFRDTGVIHILVASGSNVALVLLIILVQLHQGMRIPLRHTYMLAIPAICFYALITGWDPPIVRATIIAIIFLLAYILKREGELYNSIALAALLILLFNPLMLFDVSFQLSFGVVLSLIILTPHIERILPPLPRWVTLPLAGSIAAEIGIAPIMAYYFYRVSLITTFANLPVIPLAEISINLGALTILFSPLSFLSGIFASANWLVLEIMIKIVKFFSNLSLAMTLYLYLSLIALMIISKAEFWRGRNIFKYTILLLMIASGILIYQSSTNDAPSVAMDVKPPSLLFMILYYLTLGMIINVERLNLARFKGKLVVLLLLGINIFVWSKALSPPNRTLEVAFLDVGQGDSMFLHFPDGKNVLIDGGGSGREDFDVGERILLPYLRYRGVKRIDAMILTHHNTDHMEGLIAVLNKLRVGLVIDNGKMNDDFSKLVEAKEVEYKVVREGQALDFGEGIIAYVLNPGEEMLSNSASNNNSVVLKLIYDDTEFLFTGDIERETEERMLLYGKSLDSDILKVAHHGASSSSIPAFLKFVHPESAVISVGKNNFGHPDPKVIARLEGLATEIYRTDERGTITIKTEGEGYRVFTMKEVEPNLASVDI